MEQVSEGDNSLAYESHKSLFFVRPAYLGYDDSESGFYTVYRNLFDVIKYNVEEMSDLVNDSEDHSIINNDANRTIFRAPSFGSSETKLAQVAEFYFYWENLPTLIDLAWENLCYSNLDNQQQLAYSSEEKQKRKHLQKKLIEIIQNLVTYVKLHDPRYRQYIQNKFSLLHHSDSTVSEDLIQISSQNKTQCHKREAKQVCLECWNWAKSSLQNIIESEPRDKKRSRSTKLELPLHEQCNHTDGSIVLWRKSQITVQNNMKRLRIKSEQRAVVKYKSQLNKLEIDKYDFVKAEKIFQSPIKKRDIQIKNRKTKSIGNQNFIQKLFIDDDHQETCNLLMITPQ